MSILVRRISARKPNKWSVRVAVGHRPEVSDQAASRERSAHVATLSVCEFKRLSVGIDCSHPTKNLPVYLDALRCSQRNQMATCRLVITHLTISIAVETAGLLLPQAAPELNEIGNANFRESLRQWLLVGYRRDCLGNDGL